MPENMPGKGIGHFFGAMRIDAFRPADEFKLHMDNWIKRFRNAKTVEGFDNIIIPGEPEAAIEIERLQNGFPLLTAVSDDLKMLSEKFSVNI